MEKFYDKFIKTIHDEPYYEVKVHCYNDLGGSMSLFYKGEIMSNEKLDNDFKPIAYYGVNYNIFDVKSGYLVLIRDSVFKDIVPIWALDKHYIENYLCVDIYGNEIENLKVIEDYKKLTIKRAEQEQNNCIFLESLKRELKTKEDKPKKKNLFQKIKEFFI